MSERIDHVATAVAANREAMRSSGRRSTRFHRKAQVHATLALVEQQRIANLIQLMHVPTGDLSDGIKEALHAAFPNDRDWEAELRDGLGIR